MVGRTGFKGDLLYSIGVSGLIYPILGHWVWGPGGWLATMNTPFRDFAGSTVVHTVGGMIALTGAIALGPRIGGGGVNPLGAILIGGTAGVVVVLGIDFIEWLRVDDPIGAVVVHGIAGIWGTLSLGLFASGKWGLPAPTGATAVDGTPLINADGSLNKAGGLITGLFYGGGTKQLVAQIIGGALITASTLAIGFALMYLVKATRTLRVSEEGEREGLDIHEHGGPAYHMEFERGTSYTTSADGAPVVASKRAWSDPVSDPSSG